MHELSAIGFLVLTDKIETVKGITFLGLDENQASFEAYRQRKAGTFHYRDSSALFARLAEHPGYKIVLCHYPENFAAVAENNYRQYDFDLQLSGHVPRWAMDSPWDRAGVLPRSGSAPTVRPGVQLWSAAATDCLRGSARRVPSRLLTSRRSSCCTKSTKK